MVIEVVLPALVRFLGVQGLFIGLLFRDRLGSGSYIRQDM